MPIFKQHYTEIGLHLVLFSFVLRYPFKTNYTTLSLVLKKNYTYWFLSHTSICDVKSHIYFESPFPLLKVLFFIIH